ncbi:MAG TPA: trypsin-like peptidase domain-containing protein, partial [Acidimicrobiales bacterium]|nr:trypsin-like peptidase domain-containing protein [Acidimicrobiales bacterium]
PSDPTAIAKSVDSGLVDINTNLNYQGEVAAGTGMVLTSSGEVLTNNHVIEGATSISVTDIGNGRTYQATVVGYDRSVDVAVLHLRNASGLQTVHTGNSSVVKIGQAVVGIGNAGGTGGTPSVAGGSVTGLDKSIKASDSGDGTTEQLQGLIETNAGIEPGDSGGPLVNTRGQVLGMDTAAASDGTFTMQGVGSSEGFAIPIDEALRNAGQIESGRSSSTVHIGTTAFLGVEIESASSSGSSGSTIPGFFGGTSGTSGSGSGGQTVPGALIAGVASGTPAATAGLTAGDTITSVAGEHVGSARQLTDDIMGLRPGQVVKVTYVSPTGDRHTVSVTLASGPPQ